jgi:ParB-like chromosome segregation protein Spo0J
MMSADEFAGLKKDIAENGLIEPIWLHNGKIIDGRNRYNACLDLDVPPTFRQWSGEGSLVAFVLSLNLQRRNLSSSQKAAVSTESLPMIMAEAKERQRINGGDRKSEDYQKSNVQKVAQAIDEPTIEESKRSREVAAELTGTNPEYVRLASNIKRDAPELFEKIRSGELSVKAADAEMKAKCKPEAVKPEAVKPEAPKLNYSFAKQYAYMAIDQIKRITPDLIDGEQYLIEIRNFIDAQITKRKGK